MGRYIGGEFWYDQSLICENKQLEINDAYFFNGGRASLIIICRFLKSRGIHKVLMPVFLCPSVLDVFDLMEVEYAFYDITEDLRIDSCDLLKKAEYAGAVFFINYFGFPRKEDEAITLSELKAAGKIVIEDNAQFVYSNKRIGSLSFNSFRKIVPYDGSFLYSDFQLEHLCEGLKEVESTRAALVREARRIKTEFIRSAACEDKFCVTRSRTNFIAGRTPDEREYLEKFDRAEEVYNRENVILGDALEKEMIERLNWYEIIKKRIENYMFANDLLSGSKYMRPVCPVPDEGFIPLGLPVYISKVERDALRQKLIERKVFLPVHWDIGKDPRVKRNPLALEMSKNILTLVIDQRYGKADMEYMVGMIDSLVEERYGI